MLNGLILSKVDEIVDYLKNTDNYIRYCEISDKMKSDNEIMSLIKRVKDLQKEIVNEEYIGNNADKLKEEITQILEKLNGYPIYREFTYLQEDLNSNFQDIKNAIEKYINDIVK